MRSRPPPGGGPGFPPNSGPRASDKRPTSTRSRTGPATNPSCPATSSNASPCPASGSTTPSAVGAPRPWRRPSWGVAWPPTTSTPCRGCWLNLGSLRRNPAEVARRLEDIPRTGPFGRPRPQHVLPPGHRGRDPWLVVPAPRPRDQGRARHPSTPGSRMVATNRLTGHSPGFFSRLHPAPNQAVTADKQRQINASGSQSRRYRDTRALILKKTKQLLTGLASPGPAEPGLGSAGCPSSSRATPESTPDLERRLRGPHRHLATLPRRGGLHGRQLAALLVQRPWMPTPSAGASARTARWRPGPRPWAKSSPNCSA